MVVDNSRGGAGGTIFVQQATVAQEQPAQRRPEFRRLSPWQKEARVKDPAADDACDRKL